MLKSVSGNNVSVYQVAGTNTSRALPDWMVRKRKRDLKNDEEFQNRLDLIGDFQFEEASNKLKLTNDGNFCMATGTYKPQIHVYDFANLTLKFERHTDAENVDFCLISDDWTKSVHLQTDRTIELHAQGGIHTRSRIPKYGRALVYNPVNCDLLVGASGNEVYRLNLDQGRFMAPFELESEGVNALDINPAHGLLGFGTDTGVVEFWDPRTRGQVTSLRAGTGDAGAVTALSFRQDGLNFALGTSEGNTLLFDLRSSLPMVEKDQGYGFPIKNITWMYSNGATDKIITADKRVVKIWDRSNGTPYASIEPSVDINDVAYIQNTGMFLMANEGKQMHSFYMPALGPAPKWCEHLDALTEELEEKPTQTVYENFKFVNKRELKDLHLDSYVGTNLVKPYMHGYFVNEKLHEEAKLITNPNAYYDVRQREVAKKIEQERESRIRSASALPSTKVKVNKDLASQLLEKQGHDEPVLDSRFKDVFEDPEFQIDTRSREYRLLNPTSVPGQQISSDMHQSLKQRKVEKESDSESESDQGMETQEKDQRTSKARDQQKRSDRMVRQSSLQQRAPVRSELVHNSASSKLDLTLEERLEQEEGSRRNGNETIVRRARGEMEMSFVPEKKKTVSRKSEDNDTTNTMLGSADKGRAKQRQAGRRRASKNAFRGM